MAKARSYKQIDAMVSELEAAKNSIVKASSYFTGTLAEPNFSVQRMASRFDGIADKIDYLIDIINRQKLKMEANDLGWIDDGPFDI